MVKRKEVTDALMNVTKSFDRRYECVDGFVAVYNEVRGKALYYFKGQEDRPLETDVTPEQRDYFVKTQYWKLL